MTGPRVPWQGRTLEVRATRAGLATEATLLLDDVALTGRRGLGSVLLPLPDAGEPAPAVLVLTPLPGVVARAVLLVPRAEEQREEGADAPADGGSRVLDLATAERHVFGPAPGTLAARVHAVEERHPRLWASRHVVLAVLRVAAGLLGLAVLLQTLVRPLLRWLSGLVPDVDLPDLPLPDLDLPSIPWPDLDLPDLAVPGWLAAVLATAKIWGPLLLGVCVAVAEVRRRRRQGADPAPGPAPGGHAPGRGENGVDAHR